MENKLKLHEAIKLVLEEAKLPLTAREIADAINEKSLYSRKDGRAIPTSQIHARVKNYQNDFDKIDGRIALLEKRERGVEPEPINKAEKLIWKVFTILRAQISPDEYYVIPFILLLQKEGLIDVSEIHLEPANLILKKSDETPFFRRITHFFSETLRKLEGEKIIFICKIIDELEPSFLNSNFPEFFDLVLGKIDSVLGKAGSLSTPKELSELIGFLGESERPQSIYNPFAGTLSWVNDFSKKRIIAQELNSKNWAIGQLRLRANELDETVHFTNEDSIQKWQSQNLYDLVVSIPPFSQKISSESNYRLSETFLLKEGSSLLNNNGKLIAILPLGFLFRGGQDEDLRKYLIDQDLIDTIIQLPSNLFLNSSIPTICIVLNKNKSNRGKVRLFDASSFFKKANRNQVTLNFKILKGHLKSTSDSRFSKEINLREIEENNFNLNIPRYFMPEAVGVKLEHVVKSLDLSVPTQNVGKFVGISHLKDGKLDLVLVADEIGNSELKPGVKALEKSSLLIALRGVTLKATVFKYEGTPIYLPSSIIALDVKESLAYLPFLAMHLNTAENVLAQVKSFSVGSSVPLLRRSDFLTIKVDLPSLDEQKNSVKAEGQLQAKIKELVDDSISIEEKLQSEEKKAFEEFSSLKHSTGTPRHNILSNSKTLIRFFKNEESEAFTELNDKFLKRYDIDLLKMMTLIKSDIDHISKMFDVGERGLILSDFEREDIPMDQIGLYFKELSDHNYKFKIAKSFIDLTMGSPGSEDGEEEWEENYFLTDGFKKDSETSILSKSDIKISGNWTLFKILMENILSNADKHGFDDELERNQLSIELILAIYGVTIKIQNNGKPFPRGFDKSKFIAKFSTADKEIGTGLGGYDINRIANYFRNEDWKLELDNQNEFPVSFEFNFNTETF